MHVTGQCHCGRIAWEAEIDPGFVSACHCSDCQVFSGSPYRVSVRAPADTFKLTAGSPKIYVKTAESGNPRAQAFCGDCGAPVYASAVSDPPFYSLRVGCLQQRAQLPPQQQIWCRSALPWSESLAGVAKQERQ